MLKASPEAEAEHMEETSGATEAVLEGQELRTEEVPNEEAHWTLSGHWRTDGRFNV
jgi:hypothetical protein